MSLLNPEFLATTHEQLRDYPLAAGPEDLGREGRKMVVADERLYVREDGPREHF